MHTTSITGDLAGRFKMGLLYGVNAPPNVRGPGLKADLISPAIGEGKGDIRTLALATNLGLGRLAPAERERWGEDKTWSGESVDSWLMNGGLIRESIIHCQCTCMYVDVCTCVTCGRITTYTIHVCEKLWSGLYHDKFHFHTLCCGLYIYYIIWLYNRLASFHGWANFQSISMSAMDEDNAFMML